MKDFGFSSAGAAFGFWIEETDRCIKQFRLFILALAPVIENLKSKSGLAD
jgi:hypothetical protein